MQKLVTIYLNKGAYGKSWKDFADKHGAVEEHLKKYLNDGWLISSVGGCGGGEDGGWVVVLLEKK